MEINIGDKVRFLNAVGGGIVRGFQKNYVLVEDEDGFEIPVGRNEIIVVPNDNKQAYMERLAGESAPKQKPSAANAQKSSVSASAANALNGNGKANAASSSTDEVSASAGSARERDLEKRIIQLEMTVLQLETRLERLENARQQREAQKKQDLLQREEQRKQSGSSRNGQPGLLEVDLHATELLDTTAGLSPADIKAYQVKVFRETMDAHKSHKGMRIVFIHGNGEGALRKAIIDELRHSYKSCEYQDASFQQYGFGATMVIVH